MLQISHHRLAPNMTGGTKRSATSIRAPLLRGSVKAYLLKPIELTYPDSHLRAFACSF